MYIVIIIIWMKYYINMGKEDRTFKGTLRRFGIMSVIHIFQIELRTMSILRKKSKSKTCDKLFLLSELNYMFYKYFHLLEAEPISLQWLNSLVMKYKGILLLPFSGFSETRVLQNFLSICLLKPDLLKSPGYSDTFSVMLWSHITGGSHPDLKYSRKCEMCCLYVYIISYYTHIQ
jgi:hypothetical protein